MDIALLFALILLNGVFAMSEIAIVSSRKARLIGLADDGNRGAEAAVRLHDDPSNFFSTIQVGITSIGILSGAMGETVLADPLAGWLAGFPLIEPYSRTIALSIVVVGITYFSVVVGELVPKRLALLAPESIASLISRPMVMLALIARPLVVVLSVSSNTILRLAGARRTEEPPITDEEINVLMGQGAEAGVFHQSEQQIVSNVLRLDEQRVGAIMTPRKDIFAVDLEDPEEEIRARIADSPYSRVLVCRDGVEHVLGVLQTGSLLKRSLAGITIDRASIEALLTPPLYVPDTVSTAQLLENFRRTRKHLALLVDEYGDLQGLVTVNDVLAAIVGDISVEDIDEAQEIVQREDGSWLVDGSTSISKLKSVVGLDQELPGEDSGGFHTVGGFVLHVLGRIPVPADYFEMPGLRIEVMDMDRNRIDKVLVQQIRAELSDAPPEAG
ncbi:hemolysin family protein [Methyloversatilis sp.]|uniref:hemolysin family protein n=1 Tax=Methyloversatilis sp. TaxID=2569862 RepID=UPI0027370519|nr:hemolysin family protein [Methyloversatilis sp.]MDP2868996.1 hemolysin family protein [Methyloversatilis sp.]MDP3456161.1 hemolysin family protein [Methyloversatilis sp.]MDP3577414.1 hemolysin family protein [Methyloversatilis sp.]